MIFGEGPLVGWLCTNCCCGQADGKAEVLAASFCGDGRRSYQLLCFGFVHTRNQVFYLFLLRVPNLSIQSVCTYRWYGPSVWLLLA